MSLKVLIVEDDVPSLELMGEILSSDDVEVRSISDSHVASGLVEAERFDGIFIDLAMPKVYGFELARKIRKSHCNQSTPIVIVTGNDRPATMKESFDSGGTFFLAKPIERYKPLRLLKAVRGTMFSNRRRFVRIPLQTEAVYESKGSRSRGMSANISLGGILFEAPELLPGDRLQLSLRLPGSKVKVEAFGRVVRTDERQRAGIRFLSVNEPGRNAMRALIDRDEDER